MLTPASIKSMTVEDLKRELRLKGASTAGKKAELAARLLSLIDDQQLPAETEEQPSQPVNSVVSKEASEVAEVEAPALPSAAEQLPSSSLESSAPVESNNDATQPPVESESSTGPAESAPNESAVEAEELQARAADHAAAADAPFSEEASSEQQPGFSDSSQLAPLVRGESGPAPEDGGESTAASDRGSWKDRLKQNLLKKREALSTPHVRIDNFQRPLNLKAMLRWLSDLLEFEVAEEKVWMHVIKTHCYIDFDSVEQAKVCIARVAGKRYPASSSADLVASHTRVSVGEAPSHPEASMKPSEWKNAKPSDSEPGGDGAQMEVDPQNGSGTSSGKRKASETKDTARSGESGQPAQRMREEASNADAGAESKKRRVELSSQGAALARVGADKESDLALDTLFRKTLTKPPLYWLPVSTEIAERRQQEHRTSDAK